jgi:hypothetical protein
MRNPLSEEFLERCKGDAAKIDLDANPLVREAKEMSRPLTGAELATRMTE